MARFKKKGAREGETGGGDEIEWWVKTRLRLFPKSSLLARLGRSCSVPHLKSNGGTQLTKKKSASTERKGWMFMEEGPSGDRGVLCQG